jgi:hypothetical protein
MEDVSKTPHLEPRNGVYYLRIRVPEHVRSAILAHLEEWNQLTKSRTAPEREWRKLRGNKFVIKKEICISLKEREKKAAERALVKEQFKLNIMFEEIIRRLSEVTDDPTLADVETIALAHFTSVNDSAVRVDAAPIEAEDVEHVEHSFAEDIANAGSHEPIIVGSYKPKASYMLSKMGFRADVNSDGVKYLASLLQRGDVEIARRAKDRYQRNFSTWHDAFLKTKQ